MTDLEQQVGCTAREVAYDSALSEAEDALEQAIELFERAVNIRDKNVPRDTDYADWLTRGLKEYAMGWPGWGTLIADDSDES